MVTICGAAFLGKSWIVIKNVQERSMTYVIEL